jgi:hypothetical protein
MIINGDGVPFVLDKHALLDRNSASSLKQLFAARYVAPIGHIFMILSQPVIAFVAC